MVANNTAAAKAAAHGPEVVVAQLDAISLEEALIDVEIANARVVDLTRRLATITGELLAQRAAVVRANQRASQLERELADIRSSLAYRSAHAVGVVRAGLRRH